MVVVVMTMMSVEQDGSGEADVRQEDQGLLQRFVDFIKERKTVLLEELAAEFDLRVPDVINRVQGLDEIFHGSRASSASTAASAASSALASPCLSTGTPSPLLISRQRRGLPGRRRSDLQWCMQGGGDVVGY